MTEEIRERWDARVGFLQSVDNLTDWELQFVDSLVIRRSQDQDLTFHQSKKLNEIYYKYRGN